MTLLSWKQGRGWLVFSGGDDVTSEIRAQVLSRAKPAGGVVYISFADDGGDSLLDDMDDLGAPPGYMVDVEYESAETIVEQLQPASVVVIEVGSNLDTLIDALTDPVQAGLIEAYNRGAIILVEGLAVNVFGRWAVSDTGHVVEGLNWVANAFIEPNASGVEGSRTVQMILQEYDEAIAVSIEAGSALALGPAGEIELWGDQQVTISLGRGYTQNDA